MRTARERAEGSSEDRDEGACVRGERSLAHGWLDLTVWLGRVRSISPARSETLIANPTTMAARVESVDVNPATAAPAKGSQPASPSVAEAKLGTCRCVCAALLKFGGLCERVLCGAFDAGRGQSAGGSAARTARLLLQPAEPGTRYPPFVSGMCDAQQQLGSARRIAW
jgi:hypothetical protein